MPSRLLVTVTCKSSVADRLASLARSYGSPFALVGLDPVGATAVVVAATAIGWLGAWLVTGHFLRQTRPTAT